MANRFPSSQPRGVRPPDNPSIMGGGIRNPAVVSMGMQGMQAPMFHPMQPSMGGSWVVQHPQVPQQQMVNTQGSFMPRAAAAVTPQQMTTTQQGAGGKDRNYLQQQQKLRAMASSFKKPGPLSADSLIEDLLQQKETFSMRVPQFPVATPQNPVQASGVVKSPSLEIQSHGVAAPSISAEVNAVGMVCNPGVVSGGTSALPNLPAGSTPSVPLPLWLSPEAYDLLPAVYRKVWELTKVPAADGRELVDTGRIFSILLTSGLPRDALGYIWNLANTSIPGVLSRPELNVALALVALAQSGWRNFTSSAVLSMAQQPPVPTLQLETLTSPTSANPAPQVFQDPVSPLQQDSTSVHQVSSPSLITSLQDNLLATEPKSQPVPETSVFDDNDDFSDFQSATPVQPESSKTTFFSPRDSPLGFNSFESPPASPVVAKPKGGSREVGSRLANYSFGLSSNGNGQGQTSKKNSFDSKDDFPVPTKSDDDVFSKCIIKPPPQAHDVPTISSSLSKDSSTSVMQVTEPPTIAAPVIKSAGGDKYSALRDLCLDDSSVESEKPSVADDFGDFFSAGPSVEDDSFAELSKRDKPALTNTSLAMPTEEVANSESQEWANFEDFSSSNNTLPQWSQPSTSLLEPSVPTLLETTEPSLLAPSLLTTTETNSSSPEEDEEDFGDFVGPSTLSSLPPINRLREGFTKTPDTQSVASLELGGFDSLSLGGTGQASSPEGGLQELKGGLEGVQWEAATTAMQEEGREWRQCLQSCLALLQAAARILGAIDDPQVADEVASSKEGEDYLANLLEVYCVTQRISAASHQLLPACRLSLEPLLTQVELAWQVLMPFLERSTIEIHKDRKWNVSSENSSSCCALCLVLVDDTEGNTGVVHSGQHSYHAACANLWVNCVDASLPAISVP